MKKILYIFILTLAVILPFNVSAKFEKNRCTYKGEHLHTDMVIYQENDGAISAELVIYEFNADSWTEGKEKTGFGNLYPIEVENYTKSDEVNNQKIARYDDYKNFTCPKYLLVEDDTFFNGFVSNDKTTLTNFMNNAFTTGRKFIGELVTSSNDSTDDKTESFTRQCTYKSENTPSVANIYENIISATISVTDGKFDQINVRAKQLTSSLNPHTDETVSNYLEVDKFSDSCPQTIYYGSGMKTVIGQSFQTYNFYNSSTDTAKYKLVLDKATTSDGPEYGYLSNKYIDRDDVGTTNIQLKSGCDVLSSDLKAWLIQLLDLIKIAALILTIILGMFDFFKGVTSSEGDAMKKVWKSFSRRLIAVVILFLLPLLLEFILGLVTISGVSKGNPLCGIR